MQAGTAFLESSSLFRLWGLRNRIVLRRFAAGFNHGHHDHRQHGEGVAGAVIVYRGDRDLANELAGIGLRVEHAVKRRSND
jgi:hypothetical protein